MRATRGHHNWRTIALSVGGSRGPPTDITTGKRSRCPWVVRAGHPRTSQTACNSVLSALQYVPLQCASLHMNLMTSQTLHSRWAARKGSAVHGRLAHLWRPPHPWGRLPAVDRVAGPLPWATVASAALLSTGRVCSSLAARARPMSFANGCFFDCSVRRIAFDLWWHNVFGRLVHVHDF